MKKLGKYILYLIIFLMVVIGVSRWRVVSISEQYVFGADEVDKIENCQNVLLLGAKVEFDGGMSPILKERAMAVEELYKSGKVCKIIISGYKEVGKNYVYDEVSPVREYFVRQGIPKDIIENDYEGVDTFTSLKNVQDIFGINKVLIVTQDFHLPRAVYIGRALGLDAYGFVAYKFPYPTKTGMYKDLIREWPASVKALWQSEIIKDVQ